MFKPKKKKKDDRGEMPGKKRSMQQALSDRMARAQEKVRRVGRVGTSHLPHDWR